MLKGISAHDLTKVTSFDVGAAKTMIERTEERFALTPERLAADTAYGAGREKNIAPHIPVFDRSKPDDGTFSRSDFRYEPTSDVYHCPKQRNYSHVQSDRRGTRRMEASAIACEAKALQHSFPNEALSIVPRRLSP